jgi:poly [ADP-ribose] polymerase
VRVQVLKEIAEAIAANRPRSELAALSSRFYTVIPHDFGFKNMSNFVITDDKLVKQKLEMVQSLGDIEIATKVLGDLKTFDEHPADAHYKRLR